HQDVNIMGKTATMSMTIEHLICQRSGILLRGHTRLSSFDALHEAPGIFTLPTSTEPETAQGELQVAIHADLFNTIFSTAWRAGLLDQDLTAALADGGTPLRTGLLAGFVGDGLLTEVGDAEIHIRTRALLPPVVHTNPQESGALRVDFGGLGLHLSSPNALGEAVTWAELTLSGRADAKLIWENGRLRTEVVANLSVDIANEPLFPIDEAPFETFLTSIAQGLPAALTGQLADHVLTFDQLDALGVRIERLRFSSTEQAPAYLGFDIELGLR
ncbi:MAG: hypothetical protein VX589_17300, partial [Myxococcota bacterium]|nr:hypothetical protein [Myxococcota bacterium]